MASVAPDGAEESVELEAWYLASDNGSEALIFPEVEGYGAASELLSIMEADAELKLLLLICWLPLLSATLLLVLPLPSTPNSRCRRLGVPDFLPSWLPAGTRTCNELEVG